MNEIIKRNIFRQKYRSYQAEPHNGVYPELVCLSLQILRELGYVIDLLSDSCVAVCYGDETVLAGINAQTLIT